MTKLAASSSNSTSVAQLKKELRSRLSIEDDLDAKDDLEEDYDETASARIADEQMDYLESL